MTTEGTIPVGGDEITLARDRAGNAIAVDDITAVAQPVVNKEVLGAITTLRKDLESKTNLPALKSELKQLKLKISTGKEQIRALEKRESALEEVVKEHDEKLDKIIEVAKVFKITIEKD